MPKYAIEEVNSNVSTEAARDRLYECPGMQEKLPVAGFLDYIYILINPSTKR